MKHQYYNHPLYSVWRKIKERLYNPNHEAYRHYGGNGVVMCEEWKNNPVLFIEWALSNGWQKGLHIDKDKIPRQLGVDAKIYSPDMCSIITPKENNRYTTYNVCIEYNGKSQTLVEWSEELEMDYATLHHRLFDNGYSVEEAFTLPAGHRIIKLKHDGGIKTLTEWCRHFSINKSTVVNRLKRGWSIKDALTHKLKTNKWL